MADKLGKVVRIDDRTYDPKGARLEVWTKGRHKYLVKYLDPKVVDSSDAYYYINRDKISASLTDDEVIKEWLAEKEAAAKSNTSLQVYKVIQDPYSDEPLTKRVYGDGKSPYYLNNGCKLFIEWSGRIPNPEFTLGTFSTAEEAGNNPAIFTKNNKYPERFLSNKPLTSNEDARFTIPPFSKWVVPTGEVNASRQPVPNYRDGSSITSKKITIHLPDGFTENGGKGYLIFAENDQLRYSTDNTAVEDTSKYSSTLDYDIVSAMISKFKDGVVKLHGIKDYDLKLCSPDSEACKLIEYKSPLQVPNISPQTKNDIIPGPSQSSTKIKLSIQGLFDSGDGTTPGNKSSVFEIKAKTDIPTFTVWTGEIPKTEEIDIFEDLPELDAEYRESGFQGREEAVGEFIATPTEIAEEIDLAIKDANKLDNNSNSNNSPPKKSSDPNNNNQIVVTGLPPSTPFPSNSLISAAFNGCPIYSQYDPRWAQSPFDWSPNGRCGDKSTVSSSGCGPSAVSMVINFWASKGRCNPVNPAVVAKFFADFGGRVCGSGSGLGGVPKDKFKQTFGVVLKYGVTDSQIIAALKKGYPCVIAGKYGTGYNFKGQVLTGKYKGGHFLCLTGIDSEGRIRVNDSGSNPSGGKSVTAFLEGKTPSQSMTISQRAILYPSNMSEP
jgi:Peptidase_C39 like family